MTKLAAIAVQDTLTHLQPWNALMDAHTALTCPLSASYAAPWMA